MDEIWSLEEGFWVGGVAHYKRVMHPACIMGFMDPVGILQGDEILRSIERAPRWSAVLMHDRLEMRPAEDIIVLAYHAQGERPGAAPYRAHCTSTYVRTKIGWQLVQHQQTPAKK
jgi:hypothetical protein